MSLFKFLKEAGEKLFGQREAEPAPPPAAATGAPGRSPMEQNAAKAIADYIHAQQLDVRNLQVTFEGATGTVEVAGEAPDQATREKVVLCCGNVAGVSQVKDEMTLAAAPAAEAPATRFYTVNPGDTLSKIARQMYGNANEYMKIFDANRPMLKDPDRIYPGQVLRVPG